MTLPSGIPSSFSIEHWPIFSGAFLTLVLASPGSKKIIKFFISNIGLTSKPIYQYIKINRQRPLAYKAIGQKMLTFNLYSLAMDYKDLLHTACNFLTFLKLF